MDGEKDLTDAKNNNLIPNDNPDPEVMNNPMIPADQKPEDPLYSQRIMEQLGSAECAQIGEDLTLQRRFKHDTGEGGEYFVLSDNTGAEVNLELSQLAGVKSEEELRGLLEE